MRTLTEATDQRPLFAQTAQQAADDILATPKQPVAIYIHIHYEDGGLVRLFRFNPGFNRLLALGALECEKANIIADIVDDG